jgi:hypothetical protein
MEIRDRLLGPIASVTDPENDTLVVDFGDLVRKLILSERFILESNRLREIPVLAESSVMTASRNCSGRVAFAFFSMP